jgi:hypothetical protein
MTALCFGCCLEPSGYPANPGSAYCTGCQPRGAVQLAGSFSACGLCKTAFGSLESFTAHQDADYERTPAIVCRTPAGLGLVQDGRGVWQTSAGLARRARERERFIRMNLSRRSAPAR